MLKSPGELSDCRTKKAPSGLPGLSNNDSASALLILPRYLFLYFYLKKDAFSN